jgi:hypothetical protein
MARHQYQEAAKTAIIVASEEQINGTSFYHLIPDPRSLSDVCLYCCVSVLKHDQHQK